MSSSLEWRLKDARLSADLLKAKVEGSCMRKVEGWEHVSLDTESHFGSNLELAEGNLLQPHLHH